MSEVVASVEKGGKKDVKKETGLALKFKKVRPRARAATCRAACVARWCGAGARCRARPRAPPLRCATAVRGVWRVVRLGYRRRRADRLLRRQRLLHSAVCGAGGGATGAARRSYARRVSALASAAATSSSARAPTRPPARPPAGLGRTRSGSRSRASLTAPSSRSACRTRTSPCLCARARWRWRRTTSRVS